LRNAETCRIVVRWRWSRVLGFPLIAVTSLIVTALTYEIAFRPRAPMRFLFGKKSAPTAST
jgi:hypothetical protein